MSGGYVEEWQLAQAKDRIRDLEATVARLESDIRCRKLSEAAAIADQAYVELTPIDDKRGSALETKAEPSTQCPACGLNKGACMC